MCTGDMTLVSTGSDLEFDHSPPRQCRDFGAASRWVLGHAWDYERFTGMITLGGPHVSLFFSKVHKIECLLRGVHSTLTCLQSSIPN